jgi:hypothetical protein
MHKLSSQYIAGFLDGEGNISILRRNQYNNYTSHGLHIGFTNRNKLVLKTIQKVYGGSIFKKKRRSKKHAQAFELRISNKPTLKKLIRRIFPYLICKRKQAELALRFLSLPNVRREVVKIRGKSWPLFRGNQRDKDIREKFKQRLQFLNRRGPDYAC